MAQPAAMLIVSGDSTWPAGEVRRHVTSTASFRRCLSSCGRLRFSDMGLAASRWHGRLMSIMPRRRRRGRLGPVPSGRSRLMLAKLASYTLVGIDALPVEVEVDVSSANMPKTVLVG